MLFSEVSDGSALALKLLSQQSSHFGSVGFLYLFSFRETETPAGGAGILPSLRAVESLPAEEMAVFVLALQQSWAHALRVGEGECGNVSLTLFVSCSMPPWDAHLDPDSLTGEDSLLDCSLLSNPAADLLDEFAPVAFAAQPHKGKLASPGSPVPGLELM